MNKLFTALLITVFLILTPVRDVSAETSGTEEDTVEEFDDIYSEGAYEQFVETCRDKVDANNFWVFSSEEKRSICSDELIADNSIWSSFINSKTYGKYPVHNYQIVSDDGRFYNALRQIKDFLTSFIFSLVLLLTAICTLLLEFAYEFRIVSWLADIFGDLSNQYLGGLGYGNNNSLYMLALFLTTFIAGMYALRGRMARAGSEMIGGLHNSFCSCFDSSFGRVPNPNSWLVGNNVGYIR